MSTAQPSLQAHTHQTLLHAILLLFTLIYLPRSSYTKDEFIQTKSADKPQAEWLNALTYNPVNTLLWWTFGSVVICIFRAGWIRRQDTNSAERGLKRHQTKGSSVTGSKDTKEQGRALLSRLLQSLAALILLAPVTTISLVLLGSPVANNQSTSISILTPLLALLLNTLVLFIPCYALGLPISTICRTMETTHVVSILANLFGSEEKKQDSTSFDEEILSNWSRLLSQHSSMSIADKALCYPAFGSLAGAWFGVIPIALDWERPWQTYPLTPAAGSIIGFVVGSLVALLEHTWLWLISVTQVEGQTTATHRPAIDRTSSLGDSLTSDSLDAIPSLKDGKKSARKRKGKSKTKALQEDALQ